LTQGVGDTGANAHGTRILITNSFAVNNGDAALVTALYHALRDKGYSVTIATYYFEFLRKQYPELPFIRELGDFYLLRKLPFLRPYFMRLNFLLNRKYRGHDMIVSSPGGYVNSYYDIRTSLLPLILAKKSAKRTRKKTAIYSQSIGPLNTSDRAYFVEASRYIDRILVRDDFSLEFMEGLDCRAGFRQTRDAAFLIPPKRSSAPVDSRKVAVSVREWKFDDRKMDRYIDLVKSLCTHVLKRGYSIEFLSTCQGVPGYRDDSRVAAQVREALLAADPSLAPLVSVNTSYYRVDDLTNYLNRTFAFTIGTRLHMCILSMLNGVPAFNISYEVKGVECYRYLGLEAYSVDFNESGDIAAGKLQTFVDQEGSIRRHLEDRLNELHRESREHLDLFLSDMAGVDDRDQVLLAP
jgi:polysaccharide pyruvyl transferase WcaK-like protein